jgi:hypothetical protein
VRVSSVILQAVSETVSELFWPLNRSVLYLLKYIFQELGRERICVLVLHFCQVETVPFKLLCKLSEKGGFLML